MSFPPGVMNGEAVCEKSSLVATLGRPSTRHLTLFQKVSYGMGHIFNDICAAMWFSYILLFLQVVIGMPPALSGAMMLTDERKALKEEDKDIGQPGPSATKRPRRF
uniref:Uncharacterized protein n=1 Tax=Timema poppense TaxID=170557 RepID=A0A7R9HBL7_TIMPO|nr:unnamed protein product [Timema poppensis]